MVWFGVWPFGWKLKPSQTQFKLQTVSIFSLEFLVNITSILPMIVLILISEHRGQIESHERVVHSSNMFINTREISLESFETT